MDKPSAVCQVCGAENARLERICRRCGQPLFRRTVLCPTCGQQARRGIDFCQYCGAKLPDEPAPIVPLLPSTVDGWRRRLSRYPFYARLWREGGPGDRNHAQCLATCKLGPPPNMTPHQVFESCPFIIPILPRDWCIQRLTWQRGADERGDRREITRGEFICAPDRFLVFDLDTRRAQAFPYTLIESAGFDIYWGYAISLKENQSLRLSVKHDGGQVALFHSADELLADLAGESKPVIGMRLRMPPKYLGDEGSRNTGHAFWSDFLLFLVQVAGFFRAEG